jgi:type IV pilus assembly protein PilM
MDWSGLFSFGRSLVGVDIGHSAVKVVQLRQARRGRSLIYAGLTELDPTVSEEDRGATVALYDLLRDRRIKGQRMAVTYAGTPAIIRYIALPKMPREELKEAVKWEVRKMTPIPIEDMILDFLIVGETGERDLKRYELVVVGAERTAVLKQLDALKRYRFPVAAMDVNPLALFNTLRVNYRAELQDSLAFVDIGASKMDISIAKQGVLRFTRNVQIGGNDINQAVVQRLQVEPAEAEQVKRQQGLSASAEPAPAEAGSAETNGSAQGVIRSEVDRLILEVQRSLDYYRAQFREGPVKKIILMGGVPLMPGFQDYFASYFEAQVELDDPFAEIHCDERAFGELRLMAPRFSTSVGLALRKATG